MMGSEFKPCPKCDSRLELGANCCPVCGWSSKEPVAPIFFLLGGLAICPLACFAPCWLTGFSAWSAHWLVTQWWFWPGAVAFLGTVGGLEYWRRKSK